MAGEQRAGSELHELLRDKEAECTECAQLRADVTKLRKALEESERLQESQAEEIENLQEQLEEAKALNKRSRKSKGGKRKRHDTSLQDFIKDNVDNYESAAQVVHECKNGCSWEDAAWIFELSLELEEACRGTKYFDQRQLNDATEAYEECKRGGCWEDAVWVAEKFLEDFACIKYDLKL